MDLNVSGKQISQKSVSTNNIQGVVDHTRQEQIQNLKIFYCEVISTITTDV